VKLDTVQIDQAVLALVSPGLHDGSRAWKSFGRDAMARLHEKGYISCPHRADEEYYLFRPRTQGLTESERLLNNLFGVQPTAVRLSTAAAPRIADRQANNVGRVSHRRPSWPSAR
jgi:hypothetical protein